MLDDVIQSVHLKEKKSSAPCLQVIKYFTVMYAVFSSSLMLFPQYTAVE